MDQQPEAPEARLALETGDQVVGQAHPLDRRPEHELAGVQDEGLVVGDLDHLGQVRHLATDVDVRVARVREDAELAVDVQVDGRGLDACVIERLDLDAARRQLLADVDVGQDHRGRMLPVPEDETQRASTSTAAPESIDVAAIARPSSSEPALPETSSAAAALSSTTSRRGPVSTSRIA